MPRCSLACWIGEGRLEFINAGHPSPLLLRAGEVLEPFSEGSVPVGLIAGAQYDVHCAKLQPDDVLVMFSDGVTEAENTEESMFGVSRLRRSLSGGITRRWRICRGRFWIRCKIFREARSRRMTLRCCWRVIGRWRESGLPVQLLL